MLIIHKVIVGPLKTNCYIAADEKTKEAVIIDPGDEAEKIFEIIERGNFIPKAILLTHAHFDHVGALNDVEKKFNIKEKKVGDGEILKIGNLEIKAMEALGHTQDGVCYIVEENIFTGDTLFKNSIGRADLPGGDFDLLKKTLKKLKQFPDNYKIWPGHGEESAIDKEKIDNPFFK